MNTGSIVLLCSIGIVFVISICIAIFYLVRHMKSHNTSEQKCDDGENENRNFLSFSGAANDDYSFI